MVGSRMGRALALAISAIAFAFVVPIAAADSVYHTEHLALRPVGDAPLRSGFVNNIKAQGPMVYAHEVYVLNGALPNETYTVTNNFHYLSTRVRRQRLHVRHRRDDDGPQRKCAS